MKYLPILFTIVTLFFNSIKSFCQSDSTSVYKNLEIKEFYAVSLDYSKRENKEVFKVDGKRTSKTKFLKYQSKWDNIDLCKPCILKTYNKKGILLKEAVAFTDCEVGYIKEYYSNGKVKLKGQYKENQTEDWTNIECNIPVGQWIYFDSEGDTIYSEFWNNGDFVKQVPEQKNNKIWKVELELNGVELNKNKITREEIKQLSIIPKFKNSSKQKNNLTIKCIVSSANGKKDEKEFNLDSFKNINLLKMISSLSIPSSKQTSLTLIFLENDVCINRYYLEIQY